ncbi:MAG TPA: hypothetical protein VHX86_13955 [Tepidisphaeraceae bacterium]|nr:hypothetical protein [Tepidisphaeraceae bacterium]
MPDIVPVRHADYWQQKRARNSARDRITLRQLKRDGWRVLVIWECQIRNRNRLTGRLAHFLSN